MPEAKGTAPKLVLVEVRDSALCPKCGRSLVCRIVPTGGLGQAEVFPVGGPRAHRTPDRKNWCPLTMWSLADGHA